MEFGRGPAARGKWQVCGWMDRSTGPPGRRPGARGLLLRPGEAGWGRRVLLGGLADTAAVGRPGPSRTKLPFSAEPGSPGPEPVGGAGAAGMRRVRRGAWEGSSARCQALSALSGRPAQKGRWPVPPAPTSEVLTALRGLLPRWPSPDTPREVRKERARSSEFSRRVPGRPSGKRASAPFSRVRVRTPGVGAKEKRGQA